VLIAQAAEVLRQTYDGRKVAALFVDSAFGAPIVERLHTLGFSQAIEVNFGGPSPDHHQANQRAYMWTRLKDWLLRGAIDELPELEIGLTGPGYHLNRANKLVLESKQDMQKRGEASPDDADALCLTFAQPVAPEIPQEAVEMGYGGPLAWMA
jgi:phage terminase large subunit